MFKLTATSVIVAAAFAVSVPAHAFEPFTIKDIRIEGLQRVEPGTVFSYLPMKVNETFDEDKSIEAVKALFATKLFKDVRIEIEQNVLVIWLVERPAIASIEFSGLKEFKKDALITALKSTDIAESRVYDQALVERAEQEIKKQYLARGKYGVQITTTVTPLERNRVSLSFVVNEGETTHIKQIRIVGAKAFRESKLKDQFQLTEPTVLSWYTKNDQYSREKLEGDLETLKSYYLNRGYLEFSVDSTQVSITPDKEDIYLTINVTEGDKYQISKVDLSGDMLGQEASFKALLDIKPGDTYSAERVNEITKKITDRLGKLGYAFAKVNTVPEIDRENRTVALGLFVDPGKRVYVRRINIAGNSVSRDEVVRREFRQLESSWYDADKIRMSKERLERLGFFQEVNMQTQVVPGTNDQVDVTATISEKPINVFSASAGYAYGGGGGVVLAAGFNQDNVFGSGKNLAISLNTSRTNRIASITHTDPYFTADGISRALTISHSRTDYSKAASVGNWRQETNVLGLTFGVPLTEHSNFYFGASVEHNNLALNENSPVKLLEDLRNPLVGGKHTIEENVWKCKTVRSGDNDVQQCGLGLNGRLKQLSYIPNIAWTYDSRDSVNAPNKGMFTRLSTDVSFGDQRYVRFALQQQQYLPITKDYTFSYNFDYSVGKALGGYQYPSSKRYYAGGNGSIRGFEDSSLGPRDENGNVTGGLSRLVLNTELSFPFFAMGNNRSLRWFVYGDAGNVFDKSSPTFSDLRYSAGIGISWASPLGPLKISYGTPLNKKPGDKVGRIQFQVSAGF